MTEPRICVGVDDSKPSIAALRFAIDEASRRGAAVVAVTSWAVEEHANYGIGVTAEERSEYDRRARQRQAAAVELALAEGDQRPQIIHRVVQSTTGPHPGDELVHESRRCAMLVVGTEHKGILKRAAVGSTSSYCIRHAHVPVVIVPNDDTAVSERGEDIAPASAGSPFGLRTSRTARTV